MSVWTPIWKVQVDGTDLTDVTLANLSITSGRTDIFSQAQAGTCQLELINLDNSVYAWGINTQLSVEVKNSSGTATGGYIVSDGSLGGGLNIQGNLNDQPSVTPHVYVNTLGKLLVNTTTDAGAYKLQVNGDIYAPTARFYSVNPGGYSADLNLRADGTLTTSSSDIRLKKNIETIKDPLKKVMSLRGVTYNWRDTAAPRRMMGMIAQEVLPIVPELVFQNKNDGYYGIN